MYLQNGLFNFYHNFSERVIKKISKKFYCFQFNKFKNQLQYSFPLILGSQIGYRVHPEQDSLVFPPLNNNKKKKSKPLYTIRFLLEFSQGDGEGKSSVLTRRLSWPNIYLPSGILACRQCISYESRSNFPPSKF